MQKSLLYFLILLLILTSCTKQTDTTIDVEESIIEHKEIENDDTEPVTYTGEIISDGYFGDKGRIYFVPDKETRELLRNEYPYFIDAGDSIPLDYDGFNIVKGLPKELGIYNVEVEADYKTGNIFSNLKSIKLTDEIGTIEYEGKEYPTNELDETVTSKDRVCGLIVSNVRRLPMHDDNMTQQGMITFDYENVKELLGKEPFEKNCEITINNYKINKTSYTSSVDTADLISVNFYE